MGFRGPKPVDVGALRGLATQWGYILYGLRDGQSGLLATSTWRDWQANGQEQVREGTGSRILFARVHLGPDRSRILTRLVEQVVVEAKRKTNDDPSQLQILFPLKTTISGPAPQGLEPGTILAFPPLPARPDLWQQLKIAKSTEKMQRTLSEIYGWLSTHWPSVQNDPRYCRVLCESAPKLQQAKKLWNYPSKKRPSSDEKRIEFLAKALAGLTLERLPATATTKLCRWRIPKLWLTPESR